MLVLDGGRDHRILVVDRQDERAGARPNRPYQPRSNYERELEPVGRMLGENIEVLLDVKDASNNCTVTNTGYTINLRTSNRHKMLETSFTSYLGVAPYDGAGRAQVLLNSRRADPTDSSVPFLHTWRAVDERNTVEAYTTQPPDEAGFWKFDYSAAKHCVAGSLHVEQGKVISRDAHSIVFRLRRTG